MTAFNWDSKISNDGGDFVLLEPGIYPFSVKAFEKGYYNGGGKIPACPKAQLTLRVGTGANASDVPDGILLDSSLEWKICQFFNSIGMRRHGEEFTMNWDAIVGKTGYLEIEHREYEKDGEKRKTNQVKKYIDPADMAQAPAQPATPAPAAW